MIVAGTTERDRVDTRPTASLRAALGAGRGGAGGSGVVRARSPCAAPARAVVGRRGRGRADGRRHSASARAGHARRGRTAGRDVEPDAVGARARARDRAPLPGRRVPRAEDAGDGAARKHRLPAPPRTGPCRARRISQSDAARLSRLVDDLLVLVARGRRRRPRRRGATRRSRSEAAAADARVVVDAPSPVAVRGDRAALERALANLVDNADRYGPPGGRITVAVRQTDGFGSPRRYATKGPAWTARKRRHAFERFWRGATRRGGLRPRALDRPRDGRAPRRARERPRVRVHDRVAGSHGLLKRPG